MGKEQEAMTSMSQLEFDRLSHIYNDHKNAVITRRKLQALVALGYSFDTIAQQLGKSRKLVSDLTSGRVPINAVIMNQIDEVYDQLEMTPGDNDTARQYARRHKWLPPLAWDNINDLHEQPDTSSLRKVEYRNVLPPRDDLYELLQDRITPEAIAQRFGVTEKAVERSLYRLNLKHLTA